MIYWYLMHLPQCLTLETPETKSASPAQGSWFAVGLASESDRGVPGSAVRR